MADTLFLERHMDWLVSVVLGMNWWDEWKWKIVDFMAQLSDIIVRFNGWHNAWHTVIAEINGILKEFDLHILPSWMVTEGKTNIISSWCAVGVNLNKVNGDQIEQTDTWIICNSTLRQLVKKENDWHKYVTVWLVPELHQLESKWVDVGWRRLKISQEAPIIGMHHVLMDAADEKLRVFSWQRAIWSTGSGISPAYAGKALRKPISLAFFLKQPESYYQSIKQDWAVYGQFFPKISVDILINRAKAERKQLLKLIEDGVVDVLDDEVWFIDEALWKMLRILWEWAQSSMISSDASLFGTASNQNIASFCKATWISLSDIFNVFLVNKLPPSSVWERAEKYFAAYPDSPILKVFRDIFDEYGTSTWRARQVLLFILTHIAKWTDLALSGFTDYDRVVPVLNRIDGLSEAAKLDIHNRIVVATWYYKEWKDNLGKSTWLEAVGIVDETTELTHDALMHNSPGRSESSMETMFDINPAHVVTREVQWDSSIYLNDNKEVTSIWDWVMNLSWIYKDTMLWANNQCSEILAGTWWKRTDLVLLSQ